MEFFCHKQALFCLLIVISTPVVALNVSMAPAVLNASTICSESCMQINPYNPETGPPVRHCARLSEDNTCACDWEKILTPDGDCRCRNPFHSLDPETGICRCDPDREDGCENGKEPGCPEDSVMEEGTCICLECKENRCEEGLKAVVQVAGEDKPGHCCDIYKCIDSKRDCTFKEKIYLHGSSWSTNATCDKCLCRNGIVVCEKAENCTENCTQNCTGKENCYEILENLPKVYKHGQLWMRDSCTSCLCENGTPKCMSHYCEDSPSVVTFTPQKNSESKECATSAGSDYFNYTVCITIIAVLIVVIVALVTYITCSLRKARKKMILPITTLHNFHAMDHRNQYVPVPSKNLLNPLE